MVFLFLLIIIISILIFSKIKIQIINFRFNSQTKRHINKDYKIVIRLCILGLIPIFKINITKIKLEKINLKKKINFKLLEENTFFPKEIGKAIKRLNISIKNLNLQVNIGTQNAGLTAIIVPVISTMIALLLRKNMKRLENQTFIIHPIYQNQNLVNLYISGIFEIKVRHIINVVYILNKKGVKKNERTSNRRSYDYSYE